MEYIGLIVRNTESVGTALILADNDSEAFENAKNWASSLDLAPDDRVWLLVKSPDLAIRTFQRGDF
jgi:hypothetical protein